MNQKQRTLALFLNVALALIVHKCVSGGWMVSGDIADTWIVGMIAYWVLALVSSPYFSPPKDSLANGIAAFVALATINLGAYNDAHRLLEALKSFGLLISVAVITLALLAIVALSSHRESGWSKWAYRLADKVGSGRLLFTPVVLASVFAAYGNNLPAILSITILWAIAIGPGLAELLMQLPPKRREIEPQKVLGRVERFDSPGLVRVLLTGRSEWPVDGVVVVGLTDGKQVFAMPLFESPGVDGRIGTAVVARPVSEYVPDVRPLEAHECGGHELRSDLIEDLGRLGHGAALAGIVVEGSSIANLRFEAVNEDLLKGQIVAILMSSGHVYYQITDATTAEEVLSSELHGRRIATAIQLGAYEENLGFARYDWVPPMNSCVFVVPDDTAFAYQPSEDQRSVGVLPGTNCDIYADIDQIVHYHAAILGVTGTGKTELSLDLVRGAVEQKCKVVCVDFTGEYAKRLNDLSPKQLGLAEDLGNEYEDAIFAVETGAYGAGKEKAALKDFVDRIRPRIERQVEEFLEGDGCISVLELAEITNTKASIRTTELFLSSLMASARKNRRKHRILIVLEEAHTIVPETGGSGMDYESKWVVERIGQIALQGRKYGIGLLVVSQRTALVSKTILSQCNTFFSFALVDQTSLGFLSSVFSSDHVAAIPNLRSLEMMCYGRAVSSARPLLVKRRFDQAKVVDSERLNA